MRKIILFFFILIFSNSTLADDKMILGLEVYKNKADTLRAAGDYAAAQGKFGFYTSIIKLIVHLRVF